MTQKTGRVTLKKSPHILRRDRRKPVDVNSLLSHAQKSLIYIGASKKSYTFMVGIRDINVQLFEFGARKCNLAAVGELPRSLYLRRLWARGHDWAVDARFPPRPAPTCAVRGRTN